MSLVEVWIANTDATGVIPHTQLDMLDENDIAKWRRIRSAEDRRRFLIGRILLRKALSSLIDEEPQNWRFIEGAGGKPSLSPEHGVEGIDFNVSHSGNAVVVAISTGGRVGVDIERFEDDVDEDEHGLYDCVFTERELDLLERVPGYMPRRDTLKLWTVKEAYAKLLGVDSELDAFDFEVGPGPWRIVRAAEKARTPQPVHFETQDVALGDESYHLALAALPGSQIAPRASFRLVDPLA